MVLRDCLAGVGRLSGWCGGGCLEGVVRLWIVWEVCVDVVVRLTGACGETVRGVSFFCLLILPASYNGYGNWQMKIIASSRYGEICNGF